MLREHYTSPRGSVWIHAPKEHTRNATPGCLPCWHLLSDHRWDYKGSAQATTWTNVSHAGKAGCPVSRLAQGTLWNRWKGRLVTLLAQPAAKLLNTDSMSHNKELLTFSYISHRWIVNCNQVQLFFTTIFPKNPQAFLLSTQSSTVFTEDLLKALVHHNSVCNPGVVHNSYVLVLIA